MPPDPIVAPERRQQPSGEGELKLAMTLTVTAAIAITGTAQGNHSTDTLRHSRDVVRFFQNHSWLRAPNQPNCQAIPWTRSCRIARRLYTHHSNRIQKLEWDYQHNWRSWLPDNWRRVGTCETGYGGDPDFTFANGSFVSAFGISRSIYDRDAAHAGGPAWNDKHPPTPRQQYEAAVAHYEMFGDGWGCPGP